MKRLTLALISLLLLTSVSCTEKGKPMSVNAPDTRPRPENSLATVNDNVSPSSEAQRFVRASQESKDSLVEVVLPMSATVLARARVVDKASLTSRSRMDELIVLNNLVIQVSEKDRARPEYMQVLNRYEAALAFDCGTLRDSCVGLRYLKLAANSATVMKLIAKSDSAHYFRYLMFSLEMKNRLADREFLLLLFARPQTQLPTDEAAALQATKAMLVTALQVAGKSNTPSQLRSFLESIGAWDMIIQGQLDLASLDAIYPMIASAGLLYTENGSLHPSLLRLIRSRESEADGYMAKQNALKAQKLFSPELVGAKYTDHFDELFFIVDAVFTERMSAQNAAILFGSSKKTAQELQTAVENYLRIQFLVALHAGTALVKTIFEAEVPAKQLLEHAVNETPAIQRVWGSFKSKSSPLQNFALLASKQRADSAAIETAFNNLFNSIDKSISMVAVYPHTLALFHILSQTHFTIREPWTGRIFDTGDLMNMLFHGGMSPLFSYSEDTTVLNGFQVLYAFDMAVRTNLFQIVNIDTDFFISDTLRRLNGKPLNFIDQELQLVDHRFKETTSFQEFRDACAEFRTGEKRVRHMYLSDLHASPYYGTLLSDVFESVTSGSTTVGQAGRLEKKSAGLMYFDPDYSEMIEKARLDLGNNLRQGNAMLSSLVSYLRHNGMNQSQIDAKTALTRKTLAEMEAKRAAVLSTSRRWFEDIGKCMWKADARETQVEMQVLAAEKAYLRQIHRDISRLRLGVSGRDLMVIQQRPRLSGMPSGFRGYDSTTVDGYRYNKIDFLLRIARYLSSGLTTEEGSIAPIAPSVRVDLGESLDGDSPVITDSSQYFLPYSDSEEEFVNSALKALYNGKISNNRADTKTGFQAWLNIGTRIIPWGHYLTALSSLYRLEHEVSGKNILFPPELILQSQEQILKMTKLTPDERDLYTIVNYKEKYSPVYFDFRVMTYGKKTLTLADAWGLFDLPLRIVQHDQLGYSWDDFENGASPRINDRMSYFKSGQDYYVARAVSHRGASVIPYNVELDQKLDASLRKFIQSEQSSIADFQNLTVSYTKQVLERPRDQQPSVDINLFTTIQGTMLSDIVIPSNRADLHQFQQATQFCFATDKPCTEFK